MVNKIIWNKKISYFNGKGFYEKQIRKTKLYMN